MKSCNIHNKSAYYYDFWKSCDTEDWRNDENSEIDYILKSIQIGNQYYKLQLNFTILHFSLYFWSNKYSLDEKKILIKNITNRTDPKLLMWYGEHLKG